MSAIQQMLIGGNAGVTLKSAITAAGLTTGLKLCLDAGDSSSYDPSVQTDKWLDVAGSGYDFFLGSGTGSDAADPTFTGVAGDSQSYFAFDGGDYFTYDTTNETWMQNLHKNNAVFSIVTFFYNPDTASSPVVGTTTGADTGFILTTGATKIVSAALNAGASAMLQQSDNIAGFSSGAYHMVAMSLTEATGSGGGFYYFDGAYAQVGGSDTFNSTYTSPSSGNAGQTMRLTKYNTDLPPSGTKLSCTAIWEGTALTKANMDTIWAAMRGRFGI